MTKTKAPCCLTTIDQHKGDHHTGMRIMELTEVRTDYGDYTQESWDDLSEADQAWWVEMLSDLHDAQVELEELDCDVRARAKELYAEAFGNCAHYDLEQYASVLREAIKQAKAE